MANEKGTVLIGGGSGMTGRALSTLLINRGYGVIILSRDPHRAANKKQQSGLRFAAWDPQKRSMDAEAIREAKYIINLAGANVGDKRWTDRRKKEIVNSRVDSGETIVQALRQHQHQVKAVISASAIGYYGPDPQIPNPRPFEESDPPYTDFLANTCRQWEDALEPAGQLGIRLVKLRTGPVLSTRGGMLKAFLLPLQFRVAPVLGSGQQVNSWIHINDLCRIYLHALENESMRGAYNAVSPEPASNRQIMIQLAKSFAGSFYIRLPIPAFLIKLMFGELSIEVLKSSTVSCRKLVQAGFTFQYPGLSGALDQLAGKTA